MHRTVEKFASLEGVVDAIRKHWLATVHKAVDLEHYACFGDILVHKEVNNFIHIECQQESLLFEVRLELKIGDVDVLSLCPVLDRVANLQLSQVVQVKLGHSDI